MRDQCNNFGKWRINDVCGPYILKQVIWVLQFLKHDESSHSLHAEAPNRLPHGNLYDMDAV